MTDGMLAVLLSHGNGKSVAERESDYSVADVARP